MAEDEKKKIILEFLKKNNIGVIASVRQDATPESAVIGVSQRDNLELIFDTLTTARKYKILKSNPHVAFVIGWDESITVQYEGVAHEVEGVELEECTRIHLGKIPSEQKFIERGAAIFKVVPTWIRYSDFNKDPWEIFELFF